MPIGRRAFAHLMASAGVVVLLGCETEPTESWKIVEIITKEETTSESSLHMVEVRNCEEREQKTSSCSSSSGQKVSVNVTASGHASTIVPLLLPVAASVDLKAEFGYSSTSEQGSGETLTLPEATRGRVARFTIRRTYSTYRGKATAQSPTGTQRVVDYSFPASCSQSIVSREILRCEEADNQLPEPEPAQPPADLQSRLLGTWAYSKGHTLEFTPDGKEKTSLWYLADSTYKWIDATHIEEKSWLGVKLVWEVRITGDTLELSTDDLTIRLTRVSG